MPFFPSLPEDATIKHVFTAHPESVQFLCLAHGQNGCEIPLKRRGTACVGDNLFVVVRTIRGTSPRQVL